MADRRSRRDVVVEIPRGSRNKYEMDHETGVIWLDRRLFSATTYPADYGFVPEHARRGRRPARRPRAARGSDVPRLLVRARPVGVFWMTDDKGPDAKIICVPPATRAGTRSRTSASCRATRSTEIEHFFEVYKQLEPGQVRRHRVATKASTRLAGDRGRRSSEPETGRSIG